MKYNSLNKNGIKAAKVPLFNGGLNLFNDEEIKENQLTKAANVEFRNGRLSLREGICAEKTDVLNLEMVGGAEEYEYILTDTKVYLNDNPMQLAYVNVRYDESNHFIFVYLLTSDKQNLPIGYLHFQRMDDSTFYIPEKIVFYSGKAREGSGIYAFVTLKNKHNDAETEHVIYEFSQALDTWQKIRDFYVPTVYINGRGDKYDTAKVAGSAVSSAPTELEAPNLLNGRFYAYYTSDSYSSSFRLPYTHLANEAVLCRIYYNLTSYADWLIPAGATSDKQTFFGAEVTANVDREKGVVYFTVGDEAFVIPVINLYRENNIRISAKTDQHDNFDSVVSSDKSVAVGSEIVFAGGENGNEIYYTTFGNPLYFPKVTDNLIGFNKTPITALSVVDEKVICYKPDGIYTANLKKKAPINTTAILIDNNSLFYKAFTFDMDCISDKIGCVNRKYICKNDNESVFLSDSQKLYRIDSSNKKLNEFSEKIQKIILSSCEKGAVKSVFQTDEYYILNCGDSAVVISKGEDEAAYLWAWDDNLTVIDGFTQQGKTCLLCCNPQKTVCYTADFGGNKDKFLKRQNFVLSEESSNYKWNIKTKEFTLGSFDSKKQILTVCLELNSKSRVRVIFSEKSKILASFFIEKSDFPNEMDYIKIPCFFHDVSTLQIELKAEKEFSLGRVNIYYTELLK